MTTTTGLEKLARERLAAEYDGQLMAKILLNNELAPYKRGPTITAALRALTAVLTDLSTAQGEIERLKAALEPMFRVVDRMTYSYGYPSADIAADLEMPKATVMTVLRFLEAMELATKHPFFGEDDHLIRGSGYSLTKQGDDLRAARAIRKDENDAV